MPDLGATDANATCYDDVPFSSFHGRVVCATLFGSAIDGFELGLIGIALQAAGSELAITAAWAGALGAASLFGLFFGALLTGPMVDRGGRRPFFAWNMALIAVACAAQFLVRSPFELLELRFVLGVLLGTDYVVGKTILGEFCPRRSRGRALGTLAIAWAAGYTGAFFVGEIMVLGAGGSWRWILLTGALPALVALPLRISVPESPVWLVSRGQRDRAAAIVARYLGPNVALPEVVRSTVQTRRRDLFSPDARTATLVGATFYTCQVIPYFALGTFVTRVFEALHLPKGPQGSIIYNIFLLLGAITGSVIVDLLPRRSFIMIAFAATFLALVPLAMLPNATPGLIVTLFAVIGFALSAVSALGFAYLVELFPTHLRATGVGFAIAMSRIGAGLSTFLLPVVMAQFGTGVALMGCAGAMAIGLVVCFLWAPETRLAAISAQ